VASVPGGVLGGATILLYGMIGMLGVRIWVENKVDFSLSVNLVTAAIPLVIGIADFIWQIGDTSLTGIAIGSVAALVVYHLMRNLQRLRGIEAG
jgi:xanthine/uracil permease